MTRWRLPVGALFVLAGLVAGCGLPQSSEFEEISGDDIQFELDETTTTSTSTIPPTTIDATSTTLAETTTTAILTEPVQLFFVAGSRLNQVSVPLTSPVSPEQVLAALVEGPPSEIGTGLRTTIPERAGRDITVSKERGTAIIDLPANIFDSISTRDQQLFFAQLVLTIGRLGGIGPVTFTMVGEPITVQSGDGSQVDTVTIDDYQNLLVGAPPETTTTTTEPPPPATETAPVTTIGG